jgi:hypothetical protein
MSLMADRSTKSRKAALLQSRKKRASRLETRGQKSRVEHLVALLPAKKSDRKQLVANFIEMRQRFRRWLEQDEFGPSRKRHTAYLRALTRTVRTLQQQFAKGPRRLRARLDTFLRDKSDPSNPIMHSLFDAAAAVREDLQAAGATTRERAWVTRVQHSVENLIVQSQPDDNRDEELVQAAWQHGFDVFQPTERVFGLADFERWLITYSKVLFEALNELNRRRGADERVSLKILVEQFCRIWEYETASSVTAHGIIKDKYTGRTETVAGYFVTAAVEAMLPEESWFAHYPVFAQSKRAATFRPDQKAARSRQILIMMRDFVSRRPKDRNTAVLAK